MKLYNLMAGVCILLISQITLGATTLTSDQSVSSSVSQGGWKYYQITSGSGSRKLTISMTGLSSDVDLYVKKGSQPDSSSYDCRPYSGGRSSETCTITLNTSTTVHIGIQGYEEGSFTIKARLSGSTAPTSELKTLTSGQSVFNSVSRGGWKYYQITSESGLGKVTVSMTGLSNDVDLYVKKGSQPDSSSYDCRPYSGGTSSETCTITSTSETIYIGIRGYRSGSYELKASVVTIEEANWLFLVNNSRVGDIVLFAPHSACEDGNCFYNATYQNVPYGYFSHAALIYEKTDTSIRLLHARSYSSGVGADNDRDTITYNRLAENPSWERISVLSVDEISDEDAETMVFDGYTSYNGTEYGVLNGKSYCSELVKKIYSTQGIEFDGDTLFGFFTPDSIVDSSQIRFIGTMDF